LGDSRWKAFKENSLSNPQFKLSSLTIERKTKKPLSSDPRVLSNFNNFVLQMADTLTSLTVYSFFDEDAKLIEQLPALKFLSMKVFLSQDASTSYKPNSSISTLHCGLDVPSKFLASLTGVKVLNTDAINKEDFRSIVANMPGLEIIEAWSKIPKENLQKIFEEVREAFPSSVKNLQLIKWRREIINLKQKE
jgi:hypothetical protein